MSQSKPLSTLPVTKKPENLAVPRLSGVCAAASRGPACGDTAPAAGVEFSAYPDGNNGDNQANLTDKAVL